METKLQIGKMYKHIYGEGLAKLIYGEGLAKLIAMDLEKDQAVTYTEKDGFKVVCAHLLRGPYHPQEVL